MAVGIALFAMPSLGTVIWPYEVKPLAARFFGSVFLAVAFASVLAMRESMREPTIVIPIMGASVFGAILFAAAIDVSLFTAHIAAIILWFVLMGGLFVGSVYILVRKRAWPPPFGQAFPMPYWLRRHFLLHTAIVLFFSAQMVVGPNIASGFWPWAVSDPVMRGIGGLFTGVAIGTGYAYIQRSWDKVRLLLPVNVLFVILVLVAMGLHWSVITTESPGWHVTIGWLLLYVYTAAYPIYYLIRPPMNAKGTSTPSGAGTP